MIGYFFPVEFQFPFILSCITLSTFFLAVVVSSHDGPYEQLAADEICDKCNCTKDTVTSASESETLLFAIDCSLHKFAHMLSEWPKEIGENHTSEYTVEVINEPISYDQKHVAFC